MAFPFTHPDDQHNASLFYWPMTPAPAPVVFVNGSPSVTKEAVAECLALSMGDDKAVLIDVRRMELEEGKSSLNSPVEKLTPESCDGQGDDEGNNSGSGSGDVNSGSSGGSNSNNNNNDGGLTNSSNAINNTMGTSSNATSIRSRRNSASTNLLASKGSRRGRRSGRPSLHIVTPEYHRLRGYKDKSPAPRDENDGNDSATTLARLLTHPDNANRLAIVVPDDRSTSSTPERVPARQQQTYEAAALQAGRTFIPVTVAGSEASSPDSQATPTCEKGSDGLALYNVSMAGAHDAALVVAEFVSDLIAAQQQQRDAEVTSAPGTPWERREPEWPSMKPR